MGGCARRIGNKAPTSSVECRADLQSSFRPEAAEVTPGAPAPGAHEGPTVQVRESRLRRRPWAHGPPRRAEAARVGSSQLLPQPPPGLPAARVGPGSRVAQAPRFPPYPGELTSSRAAPFPPAGTRFGLPRLPGQYSLSARSPPRSFPALGACWTPALEPGAIPRGRKRK